MDDPPAMHYDTLIYTVASALRFWRGTLVESPRTAQPARPLKLYDIEACPWCRLVREQLTELDLDALILPCPKGGSRFREEAQRLGGKQQFPLLVDDNSGTVLYGSAAIVQYLHHSYGIGRHSPRVLYAVAQFTSKLASLVVLSFLGMAGLCARASRPAALPLELYSFESSPYSKPVRARLCELELPYLLHNVGKGTLSEIGRATFGGDDALQTRRGTTPNREKLAQLTGKLQIPYLVDPNTGMAMFESLDIVAYLDRNYGPGAAADRQRAGA